MKKLKVLIVDSGGRGHALAWKINQSPLLEKLYVAPGNAGTAEIAENVPLEATDINGLLDFALKTKIDITIVGQDEPLALGIVDAFQARGLLIFGSTKAASEIESKKVFSKNLMKDRGVPTTPFEVFNKYESALEYVHGHFAAYRGLPIVIKASGLAQGKGVYICRLLEQAQDALDKIMLQHIHGDAGSEVIIEDFATGQEVSIHAFCDERSFRLFPSAQDHKPIFDGDNGPNTGGMGVVAPVPWFHSYGIVSEYIVSPILEGLRSKGSPFTGILYPGLMVSKNDPPSTPEFNIRTLEYNARFGDPEAQVYMRLLETDLLQIILACVEGRLNEINIEWNPTFAVCVVIVSLGYPSPNYKKGKLITGTKDAEKVPGVIVFHAGTTRVNDQLVTSGGRVLGVTGVGETLGDAIDNAYKGVWRIHFEGMYYRRDIGAKALKGFK